MARQPDPLWDLDGPEFENELANYERTTEVIKNNSQMLADILNGAQMKEPSPEDMSYLSDHNIEWCCEYYFTELCKRNLNKADEFLNVLERIWTNQQRVNQGKRRLPVPHRWSA